MSPGLAFLILRIVLAALLFAFVGTIGWLMWQDIRSAARDAAWRGRPLGQLVDVDTERTFALLPVTTLGRAPTNTIPINIDTVSLQHAMITRRDANWWLEDMGSRNGTLLNGEPVAGAVVISPGDLVGIGSATFRLDASGELPD